MAQPGLQAAPGAPSAHQDRLTGSDPTSAGPAALCPQPQRPHVRHGGKEHPPSVWGLRPRRRVNRSTTGRLFLRPTPPPPAQAPESHTSPRLSDPSGPAVLLTQSPAKRAGAGDGSAGDQQPGPWTMLTCVSLPFSPPLSPPLPLPLSLLLSVVLSPSPPPHTQLG